MPLTNLTADEKYLRSYFLDGNFSSFARFSQEAIYLIPGVLFGIVAFMASEAGSTEGYLWTALLYSIGIYVWRFASHRWTQATISLMRKYEAHIDELEAKLDTTAPT